MIQFEAGINDGDRNFRIATGNIPGTWYANAAQVP